MKIGSIGDIHGKPIWKKFVNENKHIDKWIMVGDYVDDYPPTTDEQILSNLLDIIEFKKANMDKVELLWGNHELSYLLGDECSGFRPSMKATLGHVFNENRKLFKAAFQIDNHIWTHAGVHRRWLEEFQRVVVLLKNERGIDFTEMRLADQINAVFDTSYKGCLMDVGHSRGGLQSVGGPFWADKNEFNLFALPAGYHQIVGHSKVKNPYQNVYNHKGENESITFIDCLDTIDWFYEVEI